MTKKKILRNSRKSEKEKHKAAAVEQQAAETRAEILAHMTLRPTVQAAVTMMEYNRGRENFDRDPGGGSAEGM